jgi:hypothetical protein
MKSILLVLLLMSLPSVGFAKRKPRAYSYFVDGNTSSQGECDSERKIPRRLKRHKEMMKKSRGYMGSEAMEANGTEESWKHYFSSSSTCNESLRKARKIPSSVGAKSP